MLKPLQWTPCFARRKNNQEKAPESKKAHPSPWPSMNASDIPCRVLLSQWQVKQAEHLNDINGYCLSVKEVQHVSTRCSDLCDQIRFARMNHWAYGRFARTSHWKRTKHEQKWGVAHESLHPPLALVGAGRQGRGESEASTHGQWCQCATAQRTVKMKEAICCLISKSTKCDCNHLRSLFIDKKLTLVFPAVPTKVLDRRHLVPCLDQPHNQPIRPIRPIQKSELSPLSMRQWSEDHSCPLPFALETNFSRYIAWNFWGNIALSALHIHGLSSFVHIQIWRSSGALGGRWSAPSPRTQRVAGARLCKAAGTTVFFSTKSNQTNVAHCCNFLEP